MKWSQVLIVAIALAVVGILGVGRAAAQQKPVPPAPAATPAPPVISEQQQQQVAALRAQPRERLFQMLSERDRKIADLEEQVAQLQLSLFASSLLKDHLDMTLTFGGDGKLQYVPLAKPAVSAPAPAKPEAPKPPEVKK